MTATTESPPTRADAEPTGATAESQWTPEREAVAVALIVFVATLLLTVNERLLIGSFNDDGVYVAVGKAIAAGEGYRSIHLAGDPVQVKYPPGYPALLAVLWWIGGSLPNVAGLIRLLNTAVVAAGAGTLWYYGRRVLGAHVLPLALLGIGPFFLDATLQYHSLALTEPYFVLGWAICLLVVAREIDSTNASLAPRVAAWGGITLAVTTLFRAHAVALIPAVLLALVHRRSGTRAILAFTAGAIVPLVAWQVYHGYMIAHGRVSSIPDEASYVDWFTSGDVADTYRAVWSTAIRNVGGYASILTDYTSGIRPLAAAILAFAAVVVGIGAYRTRRGRPELVLMIGASLALVLIWPFLQDRFLLPLLPFMGLLAARAISDFVRARPPIVYRLVVVAMIGVVPMIALRQVELRAEGRRRAEAGLAPEVFGPAYFLPSITRYLETVTVWVRDHTTPEDRILVEFPAAVYHYTGRKASNSNPSVPFGGESVFAHPGDYLARRILEDDVTILSISGPTLMIYRDAAILSARCPHVLELVEGHPQVRFPLFFRIHRDDACLRERVIDAVGS
jgi:hypothetical protein